MSGAGRPFVVLHHTGVPAAHYDLLIDVGESLPLLTWRLPTWPPPPQPFIAQRQPDHRRFYLTHEGPVSGGRGEVRRVANGRCEIKQPTRQVYLLTFDFGALQLVQSSGSEWTARRLEDQ